MPIRSILTAIALVAIAGAQGCATGSNRSHAEHAQYAGQDQRAIKSLSPDDIAELRRGGGWGLAKAAELNGLPGPAHVLELKDEIVLSAQQTEKITALYQDMKAQAIVLGERLIEQEQQLEQRFQSDPPSDEALAAMLDAMAKTRSQLRFVHLSTHLKTPRILSEQQIAAYNTLRGYGAGNPCNSIPKGHDPAMWKKHNGCS